MIQAILLIFFGMSTAEQGLVTTLACEVPQPVPVSQRFDSRDGLLQTFADGSVLEIDQYSTVVRNPRGDVVYFSGEE